MTSQNRNAANYYIGVDGGGSNLRVAITDDGMNIIGQIAGESANPTGIGRDESKRRIQNALNQLLSENNIQAEYIQGVGIGVAGASVNYAKDWLHEVVFGVLPASRVVASSDNEIALVGANGKRQGVLILAGTGSVAFGVNQHGKSLLVGGWGYLLGDEGSGFWIGLQALKLLTRISDHRSQETSPLADRVLQVLELESPVHLNEWMYRKDGTTVRQTAGLARYVLEAAEEGEPSAVAIIQQGVQELALHVETIVRELEMTEPEIAFAGGLLTSPNMLSLGLCEKLGLSSIPESKYPPVVGAALLAKLVTEKEVIR